MTSSLRPRVRPSPLEGPSCNIMDTVSPGPWHLEHEGAHRHVPPGRLYLPVPLTAVIGVFFQAALLCQRRSGCSAARSSRTASPAGSTHGARQHVLRTAASPRASTTSCAAASFVGDPPCASVASRVCAPVRPCPREVCDSCVWDLARLERPWPRASVTHGVCNASVTLHVFDLVRPV